MKKNIWLLAVLALAPALCAQATDLLGKEELLAAFAQYNPFVLEKASSNSSYNDILMQLADNYEAPRDVVHEYELIALVKNFDNSILLQLLREEYFQDRILQDVSAIAMQASQKQKFLDSLQVVFEDIFKQTLEVKNIQLQAQKQTLKKVRQNAALSVEERKQQQAEISAQIKQTKQEIRTLKKNSKQKIQATAEMYLAEMEQDYIAARQTELQAQESATYDIKAKHKKPVAE